MKTASLILLVMASILPGIASAQTVPPPQLNAVPAPGPSVSNAKPTPADMTQQNKDDKITETIQQTLGQDKKLSPLLKNVQVSTNGGVVTLTGQVISLDDQEKLVDAVSQIVGSTNVRDQLQIAGEKPVMQQSD
jgi:small nuclear ribonucleoprotein (snRNP)-like protein